CVRDFFRTPEMEHFDSIKMTPERARIYLLQLGLYARQRRNNWPQVAANCPELEVKQRILAHEDGELAEGGLIQPRRGGRESGVSTLRLPLKAAADGEVVETAARPGVSVEAGAVLVRL